MRASQSGGGIGVVSETFSLQNVVNKCNRAIGQEKDILLRMNRLKHQQCPPQIPPTLRRNPLLQLPRSRPPLLLPTPRQHITDLPFRRRRDSHQQRPTPDRRNNIRRAIRQQYQPQIRTIFLHRSPQRSLRIPRQMIRLIDNHHLKLLLRTLINLLRLRHFLQQVLHHNSIIIPDI